MSFPTVVSATAQVFSESGQTHEVTLPSVLAGDVIVVLFGNDGNTEVTKPTSSWVELWTQARGTGRSGGYALLAAGTEGGTTANFATGTNEPAVANIYVIRHWFGDIEDGIAVGVANAGDDPPSLNAPWGSADTLWIASVFSSTSESTYPTAAPSNYGNFVFDTSGSSTSNAQQGSARRQLASATENPGVFGGTSNTSYITQTIAIRPAAIIELAASVSTASTVAGALAVEKPLAAEANSTSAVSGALAVNKPLAASSASLSTVAGALAAGRPLAAAPSTQSVVEAILVTSEVLLAASAATASSVSASMLMDYALGASPATVSTVAADMAVLRTLAAQVAAVSNVSADIVLDMMLAASATTTSIVTAVMIGGRVYRLAFPGKVSNLIRPTAGRASSLRNPQAGHASGLIIPEPGTIRLR